MKVKVRMDDQLNPGQRKVVEVDLVRENSTTILVRLPDGNTITRKKKRDLVIEG